MAAETPEQRRHVEARHLRAVPRNSSWSSSTPGARISVDVSRSEAVVAVTGEVDLANVEALRDALRNVRALGVTRIVIDASELDFLAVAAARELTAARDVAIVGAYGISKRVLDLISAANAGLDLKEAK
jgi:anti-anti-sigma factor